MGGVRDSRKPGEKGGQPALGGETRQETHQYTLPPCQLVHLPGTY